MKLGAWTDIKVEHVIGRLLQVGVLLSAAVVLAGGVLFFIQSGREQTSHRVFDAKRAAFHGIGPILQGAIRLDAASVIGLGLLLLIATPVARVVFSIFAFGFEEDWTYVVVTCIVLAILVYSLAGLSP